MENDTIPIKWNIFDIDESTNFIYGIQYLHYKDCLIIPLNS